eukprot:m.15101 g.15101  ORF g.15101 m.15101 type:complete len:438 (-) comp4869_c0_seq2:16-1329(-)
MGAVKSRPYSKLAEVKHIDAWTDETRTRTHTERDGQLCAGVIPAGMVRVASTRYRNSKHTSIVLPFSVREIGQGAFDYCRLLTSVQIPDTVTSIGPHAFMGCSALVSVTLPAGLTTIASHTFDGCSSLETVTLPDTLVTIENRAFSGCSALSAVVLPGGVRVIGVDAFNGCSNLISIVIPDGVETINAHTFSGCASLISVDLPSYVTAIGTCAFNDCAALPSIDIPDTVARIGCLAFHGCKSLTAIEAPFVHVLGDRAFASCDSLVVAIVPGPGAFTLGALYASEDGRYRVFANCPRLQYVIAPALLGHPDDHLQGTPVLALGGLVSDNYATRLRATSLRYWSRQTHQLCSAPRRAWVGFIFLCAHRLSDHGLHLPEEMWLMILERVLRHELGANTAHSNPLHRANTPRILPRATKSGTVWPKGLASRFKKIKVKSR